MKVEEELSIQECIQYDVCSVIKFTVALVARVYCVRMKDGTFKVYFECYRTHTSVDVDYVYAMCILIHCSGIMLLCWKQIDNYYLNSYMSGTDGCQDTQTPMQW